MPHTSITSNSKTFSLTNQNTVLFEQNSTAGRYFTVDIHSWRTGDVVQDIRMYVNN